MSTWIYSIIGIVFIGIMIDIIMPEGKTNLFIKSIFGIILIYILITPIVKFVLKKDYKNIFTNTSIVMTEQNLLQHEIKCLKNKIENALIENGYNINVEIQGILQQNKLNVSKIIIDSKNEVINNNNANIYYYEKITQIIKQIIDVEEGMLEYG